MKRLFYIVIFVFAFLFYWNTGIANHTEADDAFEYAYMVETNNHPWLYHPHHLLYGVLTKAAHNGLKAMGYGGGAYSFLVFISSLSAAGSVFLFFRFCYRRYSMRPVSSLFSTGLLAFSYGFWRYACEAEVILPAGFFALWAVYLATAPNPRTRQVVYAAFVSGISVLVYLLNGIPVFIAIPLFYMLKRKFRFALIHSAIAVSLVFFGYILALAYSPNQMFSHTVPSMGDHLSLSLFPKGMIGFGQCLISGNFMFGFSVFSDGLLQLFPTRMLMEELYLGDRLSDFQCIAPLFSLALLSIIVPVCLLRAIASWKTEWSNKQADSLSMMGGWKPIAIIGLWIAVYVAVILFLEPGNPEVWVLGLIPFWLLVCGFIIAPIARANELWVVLLLLLSLGIHNYVGGIGILKNPKTDYNQQKAEWVLENAAANDLVITSGTPVFMRYFRYYSKSELLDLSVASPEQLAEAVQGAGKVFILNDVFDYPPSMRVRFPGKAEWVDRYAAELKPYSRQLMDNEFGGVWELVREDSGVD